MELIENYRGTLMLTEIEEMLQVSVKIQNHLMLEIRKLETNIKVR